MYYYFKYRDHLCDMFYICYNESMRDVKYLCDVKHLCHGK